MSASAMPLPAVRAMFAGLIDYAGLFPPAQLSMGEAVAEYAALRRDRYAWMLGRFIVAQSRIEQLRAALPPGERFAVSVILDRGVDGLEDVAALRRTAPEISIETLEIVMPAENAGVLAAAAKDLRLESLPIYVEFARGLHAQDVLPLAMTSLSGRELGAKIRCGGLEPAAIPAPAYVADFIFWACKNDVPFKATAGLHHPIRHLDVVRGVHVHGFLNLLAATALARAGIEGKDLVAAVECEDRSYFQLDDSGFRFGEHFVGIAELESLRHQAFVAYGSCSFSEPADDLHGLGMLP